MDFYLQQSAGWQAGVGRLVLNGALQCSIQVKVGVQTCSKVGGLSVTRCFLERGKEERALVQRLIGSRPVSPLSAQQVLLKSRVLTRCSGDRSAGGEDVQVCLVGCQGDADSS